MCSDCRMLQDILEDAGFVFDPREGNFDAVLAVVETETHWRYAYSPAHLMWRCASDKPRSMSHLSSTACNKLQQALLLCGLGKQRFKVILPFPSERCAHLLQPLRPCTPVSPPLLRILSCFPLSGM